MPRACGVCGAPAPPPFQAPPPELAPDLDLRPGEPTRSTLPRWIATCRTCHAAAPDLAALAATARAIVESPGYQDLSGPAAAFLRYARLCDPHERPGLLLQAAWALEDDGQDAAPLRRAAAAAWGEPAAMQDALSALDALRRAGELDAAAARAIALLQRPGLKETDRLVIACQQRLIAERDTARHLLSTALRSPAQRPHVTHGRPAERPGRRSFWQRMAGR